MPWGAGSRGAGLEMGARWIFLGRERGNRSLGIRAEGTCKPGLQSSNGCSVEEQRLEQKGRRARRGAMDYPGVEASRHGLKSSCWERLLQGNSSEEASAAGAQGEGAVGAWGVGHGVEKS